MELRDALTMVDVSHMALLVEYPLRVNDEGGFISMMQGHYMGTFFTPAVRKAILRQKLDNGDCGVYKVVYGFGEAVVELYERGYRIRGHLQFCQASPRSPFGRCPSLCAARMGVEWWLTIRLTTAAHACVLGITGKQLTQKPDMELTDGKKGDSRHLPVHALGLDFSVWRDSV